MRKQFAKTMQELGKDERLTVLIGDISHFLLKDFEATHPKRFYNMGVAEQAMMSMAAGLAMDGLIPVVHSITPFVTERCFEQIKDDLCYQNLGVKIVSVGSAFDYASLGCTHHCYEDIAILRSLPNMQVVYPAAPHEFDALFRETFTNGSPTYFRLPAKTHNIQTHPRFGEAEKIKSGKDVTVVAIGPQLQNAFDAAEELSRHGVGCDLIYLTTIKPVSAVSQKMIRESLEKTEALVTIEEHSIIGGVADVVAAIGRGIRYDEARLGVRDMFLTNYGTYDEHCAVNGLTKEGIIKAVHEIKPKNNL
ncbi:MAG TPA: transketolase C-terminal domain-containing protein [Candidatus Paceibacterota bacterium]|nr:transketolase C-terminal domain-containing protein [Candidatus Paceibacterota bacterium]